ncbi:MAG: hypothetical protein ABFD08_05935 [Syntrophomonas sp.]
MSNGHQYKMNYNGGYSAIADFIHDAHLSVDLQFECLGKAFSLCGCYENWSILQVGMPETEMEYPSMEELVEKYKIEGQSIKDLIRNIEIIEVN